jgi:GNAT superfamily N-acetyltransferase
MPATIRLRDDADKDACIRLLALVHVQDRYPLQWPDDAADWLNPRALIAAWVAEESGAVLGHVALHSAESDSDGLEWAESFGLRPSRIAWVSRLFVDPESRRRGVGSELLDTASGYANGLGLRPALEVVESDRAAIALYERSGWVRTQSREWTLPSGVTTVLHSYVAHLEPDA